MIPLDKELQQVNVKQKPFRQIQVHSSIIRHIQKLFRHIQVYSKPRVILEYLEPSCIQNPVIFRTLAYLQPWYIQNPSIFRTLAYLKSEAYLELCQTSTIKRFTKIINCYSFFANQDHFCSISLPRSLRYETNMMRWLLKMQIFYVKNYGAREVVGLEFLIYLLIYSEKLAYLQVITVLVYGSSPLKSHERGYLNFQQKS